LVLRDDVHNILERIDTASGAGFTFKLKPLAEANKLAVSLVTRLANTAAGDTNSPQDPAVSQAVKDAAAIQALIAKATATAAGTGTTAAPGQATAQTGWAYCGRFTRARDWVGPPNLEVAARGEPQANATYRVATDTYLREEPPRNGGL